jgi:hypothetical protein
MPLIIPTMLGIILTFRIGGLIDVKDLNQSKIAFEEAQPFFTMDYGGGHYMWRNYDYEYYDNEYSRLHDRFVYHENDAAFYKSIIAEKEAYINVNEYLEDGAQRKDSSYLYNAYLRDSVNQYNHYRSELRDSIARHRGVFAEQRPLLYPLTFYSFDNYHYQNSSKYFANDVPIYKSDSL